MDFYDLLLAEKLNGGGGGGSAVLVNKDISINGTYNASSDNADGYKKVVVNVPNTYSAGDEGKVVSSGALVSQSSTTYTSNNTYDTTLINSVTVNVPSLNVADELAKGNPTGAITITETSIAKDAFRNKVNITSVDAPNVTTVGTDAFNGCNGLTSVNFPELLSIGASMFYACGSIPSAIFPKVTQFGGQQCFNGFTGKLAFPSITSTSMNCLSSFKGKEVDFGSGLSALVGYTFNGMNTSFPIDTIILRKSDGVVTAQNNFGITNTCGKFGTGQSGGKIYIPKALYDHLNDGTTLDYMASTNWANVMGYNSNNSFECIEGSYYETHYADGTVIS